MNTVPVIAAIVSVAGAVATVLLGAVFEHRRKRPQLRHIASRYSVPLLQATHGLLSRLENVAQFKQIEEFATLPQRFRDYARYETVDFLDFGRRGAGSA